MELNAFHVVFLFFAMIFSTVPLYFSVLLMGGRTSFLKTLYVMAGAAALAALCAYFLPMGSLIGFILLVWIYHEFFYVTWIRSLFIWLFQVVFIILIDVILTVYGFGSYHSLFLFTEMI